MATGSALIVPGVLALLAVGVMAQAANGPEYGGFFTQERIANLRANVEKYDWARGERFSAVSAAERWRKLSDEELWSMVPGQDLPRTIDVNMQWGKRLGGCPVCGPSIYDNDKYPWKVDVWGKPWKIACPKCGTEFPKNDFGAYYRSGIDETGCFNPKKADRALLFNTEHPDPADPKHTWAVDDGWGWNPPGEVHRFVGYYAWRLWGAIIPGTYALANAYLFTGDPVYAHKCGILLDRIADVYPAMDWAVYGGQGWFHSGSTDGGKIEGSIWECSTVSSLSQAYDMVRSGLWDRSELVALLAAKGRQFRLPTQKGTYEQLAANIETNLLGEFIKAIETGRKIYGNEGGPQANVVQCAVALNREPKTSEWIDWIFQEGTVGQGATRPGEGGHIPQLILGTIDRDGAGAEGSPGYSLGWGAALGTAADLLEDYGKSRRSIYREFPQFKQTVTVGWRLGVLAANTPHIGDTGACGSRGIICGNPEFIVRGYKYLKDPELGLIAGWAAKGSIHGLGRDIYAKDPDRIEKDVARLLRERGSEPPIAGRNRAGYGLVSVDFGPRDTGQGLWMYYGLNGVAGHRSELAFGYDAHGFAVCPPLGYRELWGDWPKSIEWEDNTISYNTVVVNELPQNTVRVGQPEFFAQFPDFGGFCVDSREVYPGLQAYRRTMALMQVGDGASYALDVFHIQGGKDHVLSFHALPGTVAAEGLRLARQEGGTYAGLDVPYGKSQRGARMGYSWLDSVERDAAPPAGFALDYKGEPPYWSLKADDDLHVRYHAFTRYDDVALADGHVPAGQPAGAPKKIRYLLGHRAGAEGLTSTCVGLVEPYKGEPLIRRATRLKVSPQGEGPEAVVLKVELADGAVDFLACAPDDETVYQAEGGLTFAGRLAALRVRAGKVEKAWLVRGSRIAWNGYSLTLPAACYRGKVVRMHKEPQGRGHLWVDARLPLGDVLKGSEILIENDRKLNACYSIEGVAKDGALYRIDCGDVSFIRSFRDPADYSKGYVYNFDEGASWAIPQKARFGP